MKSRPGKRFEPFWRLLAVEDREVSQCTASTRSWQGVPLQLVAVSACPYALVLHGSLEEVDW